MPVPLPLTMPGAAMSASDTSYKKGLMAEKMAALLLRIKGYKILQSRYKTRFGEIDLIARQGKTLIFVEVKARPDERRALEAISLRAQKRIYDTASFYLAEHPDFQNFEMRFDVISVAPGKLPVHSENMWGM